MIPALIPVLVRHMLAASSAVPMRFDAFGDSPAAVLFFLCSLFTSYLAYFTSVFSTLITVSVQQQRRLMLTRLNEAVLASCKQQATTTYISPGSNSWESSLTAMRNPLSGVPSMTQSVPMPTVELRTTTDIRGYLAARRLILLFLYATKSTPNIQQVITITILLAIVLVTIALVIVDSEPFNQPSLRLYAGKFHYKQKRRVSPRFHVSSCRGGRTCRCCVDWWMRGCTCQ